MAKKKELCARPLVAKGLGAPVALYPHPFPAGKLGPSPVARMPVVCWPNVNWRANIDWWAAEERWHMEWRVNNDHAIVRPSAVPMPPLSHGDLR